MSMAGPSDSEGELGLFEEPDGYFKPDPKPTEVRHRTLDGRELTLHLVGQSPLWGHLLWQGGRTIADFLESERDEYITDKTVLELGAGAGLPSLICAINGAKQVVVSDYPEQQLIENLRLNIKNSKLIADSPNISAEGYLWGADVSSLTRHLTAPEQKFDLLILADLLFNHSEHAKLVASIEQTLKRSKDSQALVFFTPYRPWLLEADMAFFDLMRANGFVVEKVLEKIMDKVMFEEDRGDELLRRTVFGYRVRWADDRL